MGSILPPSKLRSNLSVQIKVPNDQEDETNYIDDYICDLGDVYSSDEFCMYEFKVRRCTRAWGHDWTDCPFAHLGEKARRRDPRKYHYSAVVCPEYKSRGGSCPMGDACEFAHGVFESWLHPARYRTTPCRDGKNCRRKVCFFAHTRRQLRVLSSTSSSSSPSSPSLLFLSPTSTLVGFGYSSPPIKSRRMKYGEVFGELLSRLEEMEISTTTTGSAMGDDSSAPGLEWVDELLE